MTQMTKGTGNPLEWFQMCEYFCSYSVPSMTMLSFSLTVPPALAGMRIEFAYLLLNPIQGVSNTISILFGT